WVWLMVLLGAVLYLLWAKRSDTKADTAASRVPGARGRGAMITPVVATRIRKGDIGVYFTGLGAVTPLYTVTVKSRVDGQLMRVHYREGDIVHQGDLLLEIDPRPCDVQLS